MISEPIYVALFNKLNSIPGVVTKSRILKHWHDVPEEHQPALFMAQGDQTPVVKSWDLPYGWDLRVNVYIYVSRSDDQVPATILNPILDHIREMLKPKPPTFKETLGGLCQTCFLSGAIETFEGTLGQQEVAIVPITISVR